MILDWQFASNIIFTQIPHRFFFIHKEGRGKPLVKYKVVIGRRVGQAGPATTPPTPTESQWL